MNSAAANMGVWLSPGCTDFLSFGNILSSGIAGSYGSSIVSFCLVWFLIFNFLETGSHSFTQAGVQWHDRLTAASTSQAQWILLPQPLE